MGREELEGAIYRLIHLLRDEVSDESKYQEYFEQNPIVFKILGYTAYYPQPKLPLANGDFLVPDFIVESPNGLFEIIELKTPQEQLVYDQKHREKFYSKIDGYISQVQNYSDYFDDCANREAVKKSISLDIHKKPDMIILAGTDKNVDKKLLHNLVRHRIGGLKIVTYDDILFELRFRHASLFGDSESLSGASWHAIVTLHEVRVKRRQYIFDAGDSLSSNRWSVYLDERNNLRFEILDNEGLSHIASLRPGRDGFEFDVMLYLCCEFGNSDNFSFMRILVDNREMAINESRAPMSVSIGLDFSRRTIAADIEGRNHGTFTMAGLAIYNITLNFQQRYSLTEAIFDEFFDLPRLTDFGLRTMTPQRQLMLPNENAYLIIGSQGELK